MEIGRAFSYAFDDKEWTSKLAILAAIALISAITTPLLVGLVGWAIVLGYYVDLVRNLRDGHPTPLPRWDRYDEKIAQGSSVLTAGFVYAIPNLFVGCCIATTSSFWQDNFTGSFIGFGTICCLTPIILVYNLVTWPMLALGVARYAEERNIGVFFQFGDLFDTLRRNLTPTLQWMLFTFVANFVIGIVAAVPCIGWAVAPALALPIQGYLTAALAGLIETPLRGPVKSKR
ncbi:MAG: DUF4013 domain-containing protein [Anaerolineae bacterium]|nr:DUF4013 domain-containing protein [Anaerolineae bacterium]